MPYYDFNGTPVGYTERTDIPLIVQQGGTWHSLLRASSIDTIEMYCGVTEISFNDDPPRCDSNSLKFK